MILSGRTGLSRLCWILEKPQPAAIGVDSMLSMSRPSASSSSSSPAPAGSESAVADGPSAAAPAESGTASSAASRGSLPVSLSVTHIQGMLLRACTSIHEGAAGMTLKGSLENFFALRTHGISTTLFDNAV